MSLLRSSGMMILAVVGANLLAYGFHMVAGRFLGPSAYGQLGVLISFFSIASIPFAGLSWAFTKVLGANSEDASTHKEIRRIFTRIGLRSVLLFGGILVGVYFLTPNKLNIEQDLSWLTVWLMFIFFTPYWLVSGQLRAIREFKGLSIFQTAEALARFTCLLLFILVFKPGVPGVLLAFALGYLLPTLFFSKQTGTFFSAWRDKSPLNILRKQRNKWVYYCPVISAKNLVFLGITNISVLLVNEWLGSESTGYWNAALTIARINQFAAAAISTVLFAEAVNSRSGNTQRLFAIKSSVLFSVIALFVVTMFFIVPGFFITPLFGPSFSQAEVYLPWIGVGTAILGLAQIWADFILARLDVSSKIQND